MTGRSRLLQPGVAASLRLQPAFAAAIGRMLVLALCYGTAARVGALLALSSGPLAPLWSPSGLAVAALVLWGRGLWPGVALGAFVATWSVGTSPVGAAVLATGATVEALVAQDLLARASFRPQLSRLRDVVAFGALGCALPAVIGATANLGASALSGSVLLGSTGELWLSAWAGDSLRILIPGGLVLTWASPASVSLGARKAEGFLGIAAVVATAGALFFDLFGLQSSGQSVAFPTIPVLIWVAFRVGPRGTTLGMALLAAIALAATERGLGPFVGTTGEGSLMYVAAYMAMVALTGDAVAAVVAEREAARVATLDASRDAQRSVEQLRAIEALGLVLAREGATPGALDRAVEMLVDVFGYPWPSIYTGDTELVRLAAQRGYETPVAEFDSSSGVLGRVMRTGASAYLPDVTLDPDFVRADPRVVSEIAVPLHAHGEFLGVLSVESSARLDERDLSSLSVIGDRIAAAIALTRERLGLAARAEIFRRLAAFTRRVSGVLAEDALYRETVDAVDAVVPADLVMLTVLDRSSNEFVARAEKGSPGAVASLIQPGDGITGHAIRDRAPVEVAGYRRADFPLALRETNLADTYAAAVAIPLLGEDVVLGALTIARVDENRPFTGLEMEALELLARAIALAVSNAFLHTEVAERAIRDSLTGLHNRRYFDGALAQVFAARRRVAHAERPPLSAIMFDLDRFGSFNKLHGHQVGDEVLRTFGRILARRLREGDLVARYGGEEFIAIVPGATSADARRIAEDVRVSLANTVVEGVSGETLHVMVSAGCASAEPEDETGEALIRAADVGLIMAKRAGRNRVVTV